MENLPSGIITTNYNMSIRSMCTSLAALHLMPQYSSRHTDADFVDLIANTLEEYIQEMRGSEDT